MTLEVSKNTQAILLLTAPLLAGKGAPASDLLSLTEYNRLARHLRGNHHQPADLLATGASEVLGACQSVIEEGRLQRLLGRSFLLSQVIERWQTRAIWVVSRADADYPRRLKSRLREDAPAVLYGCGDIRLLETGGLAVVGSRHVDETLVDYTIAIGRLAARAKTTIVSGGAKGIDRAAMRGALEGSGKVCGVLADSLEDVAMNRENRNVVKDNHLVLISRYDPRAGFNVGNAMQRNKLIYALADAALVVSSDLNKGGTWAGAVEQLARLRLVPVFVRQTGEVSPGLEALQKKGAMRWPEPHDVDEFNAIFEAPEATAADEAVALPLTTSDVRATASHGGDLTASQDGSSPADTLFRKVSEVIQRLLTVPMTEAQVATALEVSAPQARAWLQRLVTQGRLDTRSKPLRYTLRSQGSLLTNEDNSQLLQRGATRRR